jgi:3,4-dihydroxy 2-butanone 4-phosphate synthase/GTP cyclohydrolase II
MPGRARCRAPLNTARRIPLVAFRDKPSGAPTWRWCTARWPDKEALVRVHQPVSILDVLEHRATTHSWTMASAMKAIKASESRRDRAAQLRRDGRAAVRAVHVARHAGRRPQAARPAMDLRTYGIGAQILKDLGVGKMQLLANPRKMPSMTGFDLEVTGYIASPAA